MPQRIELREKASLYRRLASIPTEGGHDEDRLLLAVADQLEREAAELDHRLCQQDPAAGAGVSSRDT
jgi:hypothetical protein